MKNTGIPPIFLQEEFYNDKMMKNYRTKYGLELLGFLMLVFGFIFINAKEDLWRAFLIITPLMIFIFFVIFTIRYSIEDHLLKVRIAYFIHHTIDIKTIRKIKESNNPMSSPAGSMDRLEVQYGNKFDSILISPSNTDDFIQQLMLINPAIEVQKKAGKSIFAKLAL